MTELIGTEAQAVRDPAEQHAAVEQIRLTLSSFDFLALLLQGQAETVPEPEARAGGGRNQGVGAGPCEPVYGAGFAPLLPTCVRRAGRSHGCINLVRAVVASRRGDAVTAWRAITEAEEAAGMLPSDRNDFDTEFGPTNVQLHAVAVAVELGEAGEALRRAGQVHAGALSVERQGRFLIDVARAHGQKRDSARATAALRRAGDLTPEQVRYHPLVRDLVRDLLRRRRSAPDADLTALALAVGVG